MLTMVPQIISLLRFFLVYQYLIIHIELLDAIDIIRYESLFQFPSTPASMVSSYDEKTVIPFAVSTIGSARTHLGSQ